MSYSFFKIGHRGAKGYVAENTLESIKKAIDLGIDGIEIDVHACASGELVVFHDFTVDRITNGSGEISKMTLSDLKKLKINALYTIPTLQEVMDIVSPNLLLNIELKGSDTAQKVSDCIHFYVENKGFTYHNFIVSSFQFDLLAEVRRLNENIPIGVLTETNLQQAVTFAKQVKAFSVHPDVTMLTKTHVENMQTDGFKVITWTVNDEKTIERVKTYGVDGIISDFPDRL